MTTQLYREAVHVLELLTQGKDPVTKEMVEATHFLHDPQILRPLSFLLGTIQHVKSTKAAKEFIIPEGILEGLPDWKGIQIGVNEFCRHVNLLIVPLGSKQVNSKHLFDRLKQLGILSEETTEEGGKRTILNETSEAYGISTTERNFKGRPYTQIVFDEQGVNLLTKIVEELSPHTLATPK
ncbi:hypothetical protein ACFO0S_09195 [Chryseomicrobium palamuruense]|uniref:Uncharacterized protein n=1 Tax=Chryseomicrobium palamuruense TaxID=682973 RepID=A0ABV8UV75_9BACL